MKERKPIFYDSEKVRWRRTRRILEVSGGLLTLRRSHGIAGVARELEESVLYLAVAFGDLSAFVLGDYACEPVQDTRSRVGVYQKAMTIWVHTGAII